MLNMLGNAGLRAMSSLQWIKNNVSVLHSLIVYAPQLVYAAMGCAAGIMLFKCGLYVESGRSFIAPFFRP